MPMVVWKQHGPVPPDTEVAHMMEQLSRVADARFGAGEWSVDRVMRQIPDHFHAHGRDPNWWFRRFRNALTGHPPRAHREGVPRMRRP